LVDAVQPTHFGSIPDRAFSEPDRQQLPHRDHSVLPIRERRNRPIVLRLRCPLIVIGFLSRHRN
jgi:hypothetical protein